MCFSAPAACRTDQCVFEKGRPAAGRRIVDQVNAGLASRGAALVYAVTVVPAYSLREQRPTEFTKPTSRTLPATTSVQTEISYPR
jgi:hypothetical protein